LQIDDPGLGVREPALHRFDVFAVDADVRPLRYCSLLCKPLIAPALDTRLTCMRRVVVD
jgi:hypothetical protein